jgi:hypothetical protein
MVSNGSIDLTRGKLKFTKLINKYSEFFIKINIIHTLSCMSKNFLIKNMP